MGDQRLEERFVVALEAIRESAKAQQKNTEELNDKFGLHCATTAEREKYLISTNALIMKVSFYLAIALFISIGGQRVLEVILKYFAK